MSLTRLFSVQLLALLFFVGCKEKQSYPPEPNIEFISFTKIQNASGADEKGILKIRFTDGDGNIGLSEQDIAPPFDTGSMYYYNFFITYYEKQKGIYKEVNLPVNNNARIPILESGTQTPALTGDIEIELFINNPFSVYDTIQYDAFIVDRSLNHSNTINTGDIILKKK